MRPIDMALVCLGVMADDPSADARVNLVIPKGKYPKGFLRGELLCESMEEDGTVRRVYSFKAAKVMAFLIRHGGITMEMQEGRKLVVKECAL